MLKEPLYKYVSTFRNYEDYHDAEQYAKGWNDAMDFMFPEAMKAKEKQAIKKNLTSLKPESENT